MQFPLPRVALIATLAFACGNDDDSGYPEGPGGSYDVDLRCTPYSTGDQPASFCETEPFKHYFQCDEQPGDACTTAPHPSADPNQVAYCCDFPCARDQSGDHRCTGGRRAYACDQDDPAIATQLGCEDGVDAYYVCC